MVRTMLRVAIALCASTALSSCARPTLSPIEDRPAAQAGAAVLEGVLNMKGGGFSLPADSTLADWMKTIKARYPDFRYFIDPTAAIYPRLADAKVPDLNAVCSKGFFTVREVLATVLDSVQVEDFGDNPPGTPVSPTLIATNDYALIYSKPPVKLVPPTFIVTNDYIFISNPTRCQEFKDILTANAARCKAVLTWNELLLEAALDRKTKGFLLSEGSTLADWMRIIKDDYPDFRYLIDSDPETAPKLSDVNVHDLRGVVSKRIITIREVLTAVLNTVQVVDARNNPPDKPMSPTFIVTEGYVFISSPGGCQEYKDTLLANAARDVSSRKAARTPKEAALEAVLDLETKGFNLPEGSTVADWMHVIKDSYRDFRYFIDDAPAISPKLEDVQVPDLSAIVFKGTFTIREVLTSVLSSVKVTDTRNNATGKLVTPAFIVTGDSIFISTPARCRERKTPSRTQ